MTGREGIGGGRILGGVRATVRLGVMGASHALWWLEWRARPAPTGAGRPAPQLGLDAGDGQEPLSHRAA